MAGPFWLAVLEGRMPPPAWPAASLWHAHEMLLGFAGAAMAGFLVTRARPRQILLLAGFWLLARLAFWIPSAAAPLLLLPFPAMLAALVAPPFFRSSKKPANSAFGIIPVALFLLETLFVLAVLEAGPSLLRSTIWSLVHLVSALLTLMGGRLLRAATAGLVYRGGGRFTAGIDLPRETATLVLFLVAILATLLAIPTVAGLALLTAGLLTALRLARWFVPVVRKVAEVRALHLGYGWLALGLLLLGLALAGAGFAAADVVHAVTIGGLGTLAFTVVARTTVQRAGLGFAAAAPVARWAPLLSLAAVARLAAPLFPEAAPAALRLSAILWSAAFLLLTAFLLAHRQPMLRADRNRSPGRRS